MIFELTTEYLNSPINWFLFLLCGILIGMAKTGLSGAGMMIVPIMAGIFGGKLSVGIVLPMLIFADIFAVIYYHSHAEWRYIWLSMPWAILGVIIAALFGSDMNDSTFKSILAVVILFGIILMLINDFWLKFKTVPDNWWFAALLGITGGFTTMIGNAAGPVMTLYLLSMRLPKNVFIGTAAWFFFIINVLKIPFHIFIWETISIRTIGLDLIGFPTVFIGVVLGIKVVKLFSDSIYRYFVIVSTILAALFLL